MPDEAETEWQRLYRMDAQVLGRLGRVLAEAEFPLIEVRPSDLPFE